jgi:3-deoxy-D-manno-octulosonic acid (KDO) 8-phosphate synthase
MKMEEIEFIESLGKLKIKDGDIIVVKLGKFLSSEQLRRIQKNVKGLLPKGLENVKVMVLDRGTDIGIIRKKQCEVI